LRRRGHGTITATTDAVLFGYSDRPVQEAAGLLREEWFKA
jgi:gentisate 1,2-dioxygenase